MSYTLGWKFMYRLSCTKVLQSQEPRSLKEALLVIAADEAGAPIL